MRSGPKRGQPLLEADGAADVVSFVVPEADGAAFRVSDDWEIARRHLYEDVPEAIAKEAYQRLMLSSTLAGLTPNSAPERRHPTTYVVLERDLAVLTAAQERLATKADRVERLDTSHSPMLADPDGLAAVLARVPVPGG